MVRLKEVREAIDAHRELSGHEARRMALRAVSRIPDPAKAADLYEQFHAALIAVGFSPALGAEAMEDARRTAHAVLDDIDAVSRPN